MTDSTTIDERPADEALPELHESESLGAEGHGAHEPLKDRLLLPLLLPLLSMAAVALLAINVSRVLLAGDSDSALAIGITLLLTILVGASVISAMPRAKTSSLAVTLIVGIFVVAMAGLVALGPSLDDGEGEVANPNLDPPGAATSTVEVVAGPGLTFSGVAFDMNYDATAPIVEVDYTGATGHTLAFRDPKFDGFLLGTDAGTRKSRKVLIEPGTYAIWCTVPGHAAGGMEGTLTVSG
jgi:hypothetical protein